MRLRAIVHWARWLLSVLLGSLLVSYVVRLSSAARRLPNQGTHSSSVIPNHPAASITRYRYPVADWPFLDNPANVDGTPRQEPTLFESMNGQSPRTGITVPIPKRCIIGQWEEHFQAFTYTIMNTSVPFLFIRLVDSEYLLLTGGAVKNGTQSDIFDHLTWFGVVKPSVQR
jgi:hypothetical protein